MFVFYGADSKILFETIRPILENAPFLKGATAILRKERYKESVPVEILLGDNTLELPIKKQREHIDDMPFEDICGIFDDDGFKIQMDLIPKPHCDNCVKCNAIVECSVCNELFCQSCFNTVHSGRRRAEHPFRALYDYYNKRLVCVWCMRSAIKGYKWYKVIIAYC